MEMNKDIFIGKRKFVLVFNIVGGRRCGKVINELDIMKFFY